VRFAIPATQLPLLQRYGTGGGLAVVATPNSGSSQTVDPGPQAVKLNVGGRDSGVPVQNGPPGDGAQTVGGRGSSPSTQLATLVTAENGTLSFIDNAVDTTTGTVLLKATFPNPNQRLWAGEFVSTQLRLFVEQNALVVPTQAVVTGQTGSYVYVISDSSTAVQKPVTVERTAGSLSIIASGIKAGDQVVTEGQSRLTPNSKVSVMTAQGTPVGGRGGNGRRGGGAGGAAGAGGATGDSSAAAPRRGGGAGRRGAGTSAPTP